MGIFSFLIKKPKRALNIDFIDRYDLVDFSYNAFTIPKRDGSSRLVYAPNDKLKNTQKDILKNLEQIFTHPKYVTAFRKNFSIKTNAKHHLNKKIVINIDIKDFFPSITSDKISKMLEFYQVNDINKINKFIKYTTHNDKLPQGAPTSPFIANMVFLGIDNIIINQLKKYDKKVSYTRYADDITFSSNNPKIKDAIRIIIDQILPQYGYRANNKKTKVYRAHSRQMVTGLVVNEKVAYPRDKYMLLRSMVYNYLKSESGDVLAIRGHLSFLRSIDRSKYNKLKFYYRAEFKNNSRYETLFK